MGNNTKIGNTEIDLNLRFDDIFVEGDGFRPTANVRRSAVGDFIERVEHVSCDLAIYGACASHA